MRGEFKVLHRTYIYNLIGGIHMRKKIATSLAPSPSGPFSQGIKIGKRIYVSGQTPIDAKTGKIPETIEDQTRQVLINIKYVLEAAGASLSDVVKVTSYLTNVEEDFDGYNEAYKEFFEEPLPARTTSGTKLKGIPMEMDAIAEID